LEIKGANKMKTIDRIKELTEELLAHCHNYYVLDNPTISDAEYDKKFDELFTLENEVNFWLANSPTRKVQGSVLECFTKVEHSKPMLSAAKTKDIKEIKKFLGNNTFYCSYKLDGLTLVVRYKNGKFIQAVTRGTGTIGEDVTEQAKMIANLPMCIPYYGDLEIRGECVVSWDNFNKINDTLENKYSHPRNLAAGSLRNLDTNITKERNLSYVVFECVSELNDVDGLMNSKWLELKWLKHIGFEVVGACRGSVDDCYEGMQPEYCKYPVDGLIYELDDRDYSESLASTSHHEGCRMALKWADTAYETILLDVEWNPTRTGLISPVAIFEEVDLDGALTTRATLHNLSIIKQLELGIGDTIAVYRSNMVIPKIDDNLTRSNTLVIPTKCPCCGAETIIKDTDNSQVLMCPNPDCSAKKIAQFTHFVSRKCMNIDGLSEKTLETLISHGFLRNFRDIYHLSDHRQQLIRLDGYGQKSIEKLLKSIEDSRNVKLENFIAALGIPNIGLTAAKTISAYFDDPNEWYHMGVSQPFKYTLLDDFGETMMNCMHTFAAENRDMIADLMAEMNFIISEKSNDNSLEGLKFCITGSFSRSRDELKKQLEDRGAKFISSVSKNLDVLFAGDKAGSKLTKAQQLGVKVANEEELMKMLD
jgi:DNA ligase (NAD+)